MEYQKPLDGDQRQRSPGLEGDIVSPHLTGATIDIAKDGLSRAEIAWMRRRLLALETAGKIDVEEEFRQACFHITVYKSYTPPNTPAPRHPGRQRKHRYEAPQSYRPVQCSRCPRPVTRSSCRRRLPSRL